jgi:phosphoribosylformylglycinamidine synthase
MLRVKQGGKVVAEIPNTALTDEAPKYHRPIQAPDPGEIAAVEQAEQSAPELDATFMKIIASPNIASKEWVYRQYDHMVRTNTVVMPGSDAAVLRVKEKRCGLAMTLDSNARYCAINPREGAKLVIAEACRNLAVSGARPMALTNCLNFASPERPEVMWQFSEVIEGMREACEAFNTPVTGGNGSFYNETEGRGIYPTPVIGMVGKVYDMRNVRTQWFKSADCAIVLLGKTANDLGASEYAIATHGKAEGAVPQIDLQLEKRVQDACLQAITEGLVESAHDAADGGLATAIAESCFSSYRREAVGCEVNLEGELSQAALLFAETPSRILLSCARENVERILAIAGEQNISATVIGRTGGTALKISVNGEAIINHPVGEVEAVWRSVLPLSLEAASMIAAEQR